MNKLLLLACLSTIGTSAFAMGCTVINKDDDAGPGGTVDTGPTPTGDAGTDTTSPGDGSLDTTSPGEGGGSDTGPATDSGGTTDGGGTVATSCSTATLFAGNPLYDGEPNDRPASGTGIHADPPLQWENLVFAGSNVFTRDTGELWSVDLSVASPVETRIVGLNGDDLAYAPTSACASARLAKVEGMAALADKSLVVTDMLGNAVLHIVNPTTSACAVEVWAGNATANPDLTEPLNAGDVLGAGSAAKFNGPGAVTTDDAGNVYLFDRGNLKIKKVANDSTHTVTTLAKIPSDGPDNITNLTRIGSKIYAVGTSGIEAFILSIDSGTGAMTTVLKGGGSAFPPMDSSRFPQIAGITTDGTGLIVSGKGYIWYLTVSGTLTHIAGNGSPIDFPTGYDPKASHPAKSVEMRNSSIGSIQGSSDYIGYFGGAVYWRGRGDGPSTYVEKFSCP